MGRDGGRGEGEWKERIEGALSYREKQILNLFEKLFFLSQISRNRHSFLSKNFPDFKEISFENKKV